MAGVRCQRRLGRSVAAWGHVVQLAFLYPGWLRGAQAEERWAQSILRNSHNLIVPAELCRPCHHARHPVRMQRDTLVHTASSLSLWLTRMHVSVRWVLVNSRAAEPLSLVQRSSCLFCPLIPPSRQCAAAAKAVSSWPPESGNWPSIVGWLAVWQCVPEAPLHRYRGVAPPLRFAKTRMWHSSSLRMQGSVEGSSRRGQGIQARAGALHSLPGRQRQAKRMAFEERRTFSAGARAYESGVLAAAGWVSVELPRSSSVGQVVRALAAPASGRWRPTFSSRRGRR